MTASFKQVLEWYGEASYTNPGSELAVDFYATFVTLAYLAERYHTILTREAKIGANAKETKTTETNKKKNAKETKTTEKKNKKKNKILGKLHWHQGTCCLCFELLHWRCPLILLDEGLMEAHHATCEKKLINRCLPTEDPLMRLAQLHQINMESHLKHFAQFSWAKEHHHFTLSPIVILPCMFLKNEQTKAAFQWRLEQMVIGFPHERLVQCYKPAINTKWY